MIKIGKYEFIFQTGKPQEREYKMPNELFCPEHGPYEESYGNCPYCKQPSSASSKNGPGFCTEHGPYSENTCPWCNPDAFTNHIRPVRPTPLDADTPTDLGYAPTPTYYPSSLGGGVQKKYRTEGKEYKIRVFVSSTYEDLKEYREAAFRAIHSLLGYSDDMIFWSADERDAATVSTERVKQCDLVILLLAHRYGYIPPGEKHSITELEYRTAKKSNIPTLAFLIDEETPWPPMYIESERKVELDRFKKQVEKAIVRKAFRSPDELYANITQALHHFISRHRETLEKRKHFRGTLLAKTHSELITQADILTNIGLSEDGLPLLINIKRSKNLSPHIDAIADMVKHSKYDEELDVMLDDFRESLERYAANTWASHRICNVEKKDGTTDEMYISTNNLNQLTSSLLSRILKSAKEKPVFEEADHQLGDNGNVESPNDFYWDEDDEVTDLGWDYDSESDSEDSSLQSIGGQNRYLGISAKDGNLFSVGYNGNNWVEWHPFLIESIPSNFPECMFVIPGYKKEVPVSQYQHHLEEFCLEEIRNDGYLRYPTNVTITLSRQSIGHVVYEISKAVDIFHEADKIHADLKPGNILLTKSGPALIDDFKLSPGDISPGWTPNWSAPEQVMRQPVSYASDIYSLGLLLVSLMTGKLIGEIRKFKIPSIRDLDKEHNVFYNPSVYIKEPEQVFTNGKSEWVSFIESCLKFESKLRPQTAPEFSKTLSELLNNCPLAGDISFSISYSQIVAATLIDGSKTVARILED